MPRVVILSGSGRYQDRWHDFTATSVEVGKALERLGADVAVRSFKPAGVRSVERADLLVVNAGPGNYNESTDGPEEEWTEAFDLLRRYQARGGPILALHAAANTLDGLDEWPRWIGGRWDGSRSMHPPLGSAPVQVRDHDHPITHGLADFSVHDERYCFLEVYEGSKVLLQHRHEGRDHALVWAVDQEGRRAVYDALGHDVGSYASASRLELLQREVGWLLRG